MDNKKYLTEERYQKSKKKVVAVALIVLIIGLLIGGSVIVMGLMKQSKTDSKYSEDSKANLSEQIETEKQNIIQIKTQLEEKIKPTQDEIKELQREEFTGMDDFYARQDKIEELTQSISSEQNTINIINKALDDSFDYCVFDNAKNNTYTSKYCSLKNQLNDNNDFNKEFDSMKNIPYYMIGIFIIISSCMISGSIYIFAKGRDIAAFTTQQAMPIAKEGIDEMAPTIGHAAGEIAKSVSSGIKEGLLSKDNSSNDNK